MVYQYYVPHPHVCHMNQYMCCKNYVDICPLGKVCRTMNIKELTSVCKKDCQTCTYTGCSMTFEQRKSIPLYINGVVTSQRVNLHIDFEREKERLLHKELHKKQYEFYNLLWGDLRERKNARQRAKYAADPEYYRGKAREYYEKHYKD